MPGSLLIRGSLPQACNSCPPRSPTFGVEDKVAQEKHFFSTLWLSWRIRGRAHFHCFRLAVYYDFNTSSELPRKRGRKRDGLLLASTQGRDRAS